MAADAAAPPAEAPGSARDRIPDRFGLRVKDAFLEFLEEFSSDVVQEDDDPESRPRSKDYVEQAATMKRHERTTLSVDFGHVQAFNMELADSILTQYHRVDPFLRRALHDFMKKLHPDQYSREETNDRAFWVSFYNFPAVGGIRDLKTARIGQLMAINGTVTRTTEVRPELMYGSFFCMDCRVRSPLIEQQFKFTEPVVCVNAACGNRDRWQLDAAASIFVDWQRVRVQENATEIPAGSMPRSVEVILRHEMVERTKPGDKAVFTGTLIVVPDVSQLGSAAEVSRASRSQTRAMSQYGGVTGLKALGVRDLTYKLVFLACSVESKHAAFGSVNPREDSEDLILDDFSASEKERIVEMKETPNLYNRMVSSVAPTVFGHNEIKRGILLMLFGGVHKTTDDGSTLRGDINVCIVGDPSTSKSQFLKYVVSFLPRAVYTSGKASSAAGLTASVVKDPDTGEFTIEAGALMLADNSICCIDEFDKMDIVDQTAIHEAMEQQTISITKAGIQATLNARTSILAAANPVKGRYDKSKSLKQNVDISAPIMSRFDLFFVVLDEGDEIVDYNIAKHIVNIHQHKQAAVSPDFSTLDLQIYIRFARTLKPRITPEARRVIVQEYVKMRTNDINGSTSQTAYRITVRQLESMVRLSEALARLHLDEKIRPAYVMEAARMINSSIIHIDTPEVQLEAESDIEVEGDGEAEQGSQKKRARHAEGEGEEAEADGKGAAEGEVPQGERAPRMTITFEEYARTANMIVRYMRKGESESEPGMRQRDIINWYLHQVESRLPDEEAARLETRKVTNIIRRLVDTDGVLLVIPEPVPEGMEEIPEDDRLLEVHANYDPEA